jgi:hypothetical protein
MTATYGGILRSCAKYAFGQKRVRIGPVSVGLMVIQKNPQAPNGRGQQAKERYGVARKQTRRYGASQKFCTYPQPLLITTKKDNLIKKLRITLLNV